MSKSISKEERAALLAVVRRKAKKKKSHLYSDFIQYMYILGHSLGSGQTQVKKKKVLCILTLYSTCTY
jgi:hypothetical protein